MMLIPWVKARLILQILFGPTHVIGDPATTSHFITSGFSLPPRSILTLRPRPLASCIDTIFTLPSPRASSSSLCQRSPAGFGLSQSIAQQHCPRKRNCFDRLIRNNDKRNEKNVLVPESRILHAWDPGNVRVEVRMERGREWTVTVLGSNHAWVHPCTFTYLSSHSHLSDFLISRDQVILLSPRTSSGSKSTPISMPSALSLPTTLALPASPSSDSNQVHMLAHSSTFSRTASRSLAGSFCPLDAL